MDHITAIVQVKKKHIKIIVKHKELTVHRLGTLNKVKFWKKKTLYKRLYVLSYTEVCFTQNEKKIL